MNRREFLRGTVFAGLAALMLPALRAGARLDASPAFIQTDAPGRKLKGTWDGRILESLDGGKTWRQLANFGEHCPVLAILERQGQLYAQLGIQQYSFWLKSADGRVWRTANSISAA